jgi:hypothetical protein
MFGIRCVDRCTAQLLNLTLESPSGGNQSKWSTLMSVSEELPTDDKKACSIVLVHGTWGRGFIPKDYVPRPQWWRYIPLLKGRARPPWFFEGSFFRTTLEKRGAHIDFHIFRWSGGNSIFAGERAASELATLLESLPQGSHPTKSGMGA